MLDNFFDDIGDKLGDSFSNFTSDFITGAVGNFITIGSPPKSNLTAAQVAAGNRGTPPNNIIVPRATGELKNGLGFNFNMLGSFGMPLLIIGGAILAAMFIRKR